jgi:glycosyltransferase involved in cell wall biosynthesis
VRAERDRRTGRGDEAAVRAFFFYADTPRRRAALATRPGSAERYALYGLDQLARRGVAVAHNLERLGPLPAWTRTLDHAVNWALAHAHGTGGDLAPALAWRREANASDVVVATIDRLGIPLTFLAQGRILRAPLIYVSVGLPERLERLQGRIRSMHVSALRHARAFVAYSAAEADAIREQVVGVGSGATVSFVPFGVDPSFFRPAHEPAGAGQHVVSVGADPHRDYPLLLSVAARRPEWSFRLVVSKEAMRTLGDLPRNVRVESELPLGAVRDRLASADVVALPVLENSYSGATTTLLQAMACARPVVVSRTAAIANGYGLVDRENVRLVRPGDVDAFGAALDELCADRASAADLGRRARDHVVRTLSWDRYVGALHGILTSVARVGRS